MTALYNEIDPFAAEWLRNLISAGHLPAGDVDERSIVDIRPSELAGYTQVHFFAGIGGWAHALRLAGWPDDRPIWTGSCPCQPFSVAGKGAGTDDARHLWPYFMDLIAARRPAVVMGEQVAGQAGYGWLDGVRADLAREGYASRGVDIPACAVDAPHIRQRLYWIAVADAGLQPGRGGPDLEADRVFRANAHGPVDLADADRLGPATDGRDPSEVGGLSQGERRTEHDAAVPGRVDGTVVERVADADDLRRHWRPETSQRTACERAVAERADARSRQFWGDAEGVGRGEGRPQSVLLGGWPAVAGADARVGQVFGDSRGSGLAVRPLRGQWGRHVWQEGPAAGEADIGSGGRDSGLDVGDAALGGGSGFGEREAPRRAPGGGEYRGSDAGGVDNAVVGLDPAGFDLRTGRRASNLPDEPVSFWSGADRLLCHDGKTRRTQPGFPLLVDGVRGRVALGVSFGEADHGLEDSALGHTISRVGAWRGFGNAIVPQEAEQVIRAFMEADHCV